MINNRAVVLMLVALVSCASAPERPMLLQRVDSLQRQGIEAIGRDNWRRADEAFREAARLARSADSRPDEGRALINLAWLEARRGQVTSARQRLASVPGLAPALAAEANFRQAELLLDANERNAARVLLAETVVEAKSPLLVKLELLRIRLAIDSARNEEAAQRLTALKPEKLPQAEQANWYRFRARLQEGAGDLAGALESLQKAYQLDANPPAPLRLVYDLRRQARVLKTLGRGSEAEAIRLRANAVQAAWCAGFDDAEFRPTQCPAP